MTFCPTHTFLVRFRRPNFTDAALPTLPLLPGEKYFAFLYKGRPGSSLKKDSDTHTPGWLLYDPVKEMQRMVGWQHGSLSSVLCLCVCMCVCVRVWFFCFSVFLYLTLAPSLSRLCRVMPLLRILWPTCSHPLPSPFALQGVPSDKWKTAPVNKDYRVCATYPEVLTVPASVSQDTIEQVCVCACVWLRMCVCVCVCVSVSASNRFLTVPFQFPPPSRWRRFAARGACPHCATCTNGRRRA